MLLRLPLRWKPFDPLTEVPIDLLMVHFALPWATQRIDPEKVSEKWLKAWWQGASRALRLSSYMIGGDFREERRRPKVGSLVAAWNALNVLAVRAFQQNVRNALLEKFIV